MTTIDTFTRILDLSGAAISVVFILMSISIKDTLIGSFFRRYYWLMILGYSMFFLGLIAEGIGDLIGLSPMMAGYIYHILLIVSVIIVILAGFDLPREAAKKLDLKKDLDKIAR